jgi:hypothetical protein
LESGHSSGGGFRWFVTRGAGGVSINNNAVYLERISDSDKRLFDDSLASEEARELAGLLTKYADKLYESETPTTPKTPTKRRTPTTPRVPRTPSRRRIRHFRSGGAFSVAHARASMTI